MKEKKEIEKAKEYFKKVKNDELPCFDYSLQYYISIILKYIEELEVKKEKRK